MPTTEDVVWTIKNHVAENVKTALSGHGNGNLFRIDERRGVGVFYFPLGLAEKVASFVAQVTVGADISHEPVEGGER